MTDPVVIIKGNPTDEEIAAVLAALTLVTASPRPTTSTPTGWSAYWRTLRTPPQSATPWPTSLRGF